MLLGSDRFFSVSKALSGYFAKSMTTSYLSAMPCLKELTLAGRGIRPASVPMTVIGTADRPSCSCHRYEREIEALRNRNRYFRRSTTISGQGTPLTRMTSPYTPDSLLSS